MPQTGSLTTVVFFITMSPLFRCFLCNQVASRRRGSLDKTRCARSDCQYECPIPVHRLHSQWQIPHVPSRLGVSIKVAIPCDQRQAKCSPSHQEGWGCTCSRNQRTASRGANTKRYRQMSGLAPEGKDDNVNEYWASERFCDPSYGWRAWNRRSDLFRR